MRKEINKANALFKHIAILVPAVAKSFHANADGQKRKSTTAQQWLYVMRAKVLI
ncbi:MAG TPA: hypothetical protein VFM69_07770 [Pricia sp.]|nr:hypothetical protein [Pricia sp.]